MTVGIFVFFMIARRKLLVFYHCIILVVDFSLFSLLHWIRFIPFTSLLRILLRILLNAFSLYYHKSFTNLLLMYCSTLTDLHVLNHPCIPEISSTWSQSIIFIMHWWIWSEDFCIDSQRAAGVQFSFLVLTLSGFGIRVMFAL